MNDDEQNRVTLRDHFQKQLDWVDRYFEDKFNTLKEQLVSSRQDLDTRTAMAKEDIGRRLMELNNLRKEVTEDRGRLVEKAAYEPWRDGLEKRIQVLERNVSSTEGKASITTILWIMASNVVVALIVWFLIKR